MKNYTLPPDVTIGPGPKGKGKKVTFYGPDNKFWDREFKQAVGYILLTMLVIAIVVVCIYFTKIHGNDIDNVLKP